MLKNLRNILFVIFFFSALSGCFFSTGMITGRVVDQDSNPVSGATVSVEELSLATACDSSGNYVLENVPFGNYNVKAAKNGYSKIEAITIINNTFSFTMPQVIVNITINMASEPDPDPEPEPEGSGTVQFGSPAYNIAENAESVTITLTRTNGSAGAINVNYSTSGGTAVAGSDYTAVSGALSWNEGDVTNKTFTVSVIDDTVNDGNKTVNLVLSSATAGCLGSPNAVTLTITDNDMPEGLVAYYAFNENSGSTAGDSAGTNTGTIVGAASWVTGKSGSALDFNAVSYVNCGNNASLQLNNGTIEAWIKTPDAGLPPDGTFIKGIISKQHAYCIQVRSNEYGTYYWHPSTGGWRGTSLYINDNNWHHLAMTFQSGVNLGTKLYMDGSLVKTTTMAVEYQTQGLAIGAGYLLSGAGQLIDAIVDEVKIYNRVLSDSEILQDAQ